MAHTHSIEISGNFRDQRTMEWAGTGTCDPTTGDIECTADLGDEAYDLIAAQLRSGDESGTVTTSEGTRYEWAAEAKED